MDNQPNNPNQEVDLYYVKHRVKGYFTSVNESFFNAILFVKRHIIALLVLLALGIAYGTYKDSKSKVYDQKIIAIPNFNSVDYLYGEVERINTKLGERDTVFLNKIGLKNYRHVNGIKVEPIVDIYEFIDDSKTEKEADIKYDIFKLLSESGDMEKMLEDSPTSKNYKNHLIIISTSGEVTKQDVIDPLLAYLNADSYFKDVQKEYKINLDRTIVANDSTLKQIDEVMNSFAVTKRSPTISYYADNNAVEDILVFKKQLLHEQGVNRIKKINYEKIVKDVAVMANVKNSKGLHGKMYLIIPFLFILAYVCIVKFISFYKKQLAKRNSIIVNP